MNQTSFNFFSISRHLHGCIIAHFLSISVLRYWLPLDVLVGEWSKQSTDDHVPMLYSSGPDWSSMFIPPADSVGLVKKVVGCYIDTISLDSIQVAIKIPRKIPVTWKLRLDSSCKCNFSYCCYTVDYKGPNFLWFFKFFIDLLYTVACNLHACITSPTFTYDLQHQLCYNSS